MFKRTYFVACKPFAPKQQVLSGVSFDAMGTLVNVRKDSVGVAYHHGRDLYLKRLTAMCGKSNGRNGESTVTGDDEMRRQMLMNIPPPKQIDLNFRAAFKKQSKTFISEGIPVGGSCPKTVKLFWDQVVREALEFGAVPSSLSEGSALTEDNRSRLEAEFVEELQRFFTTGEAYDLLPDAAEAVRLARSASSSNIETTTTTNEARQSLAPRVGVITNSDSRMLNALEDFGFLLQQPPVSTSSSSGTPRTSPKSSSSGHGIEFFVSSNDAPQKPSPEGILRGMGKVIRSCPAQRKRWLHVGDSKDDEVAAAAAGCEYLYCDPKVGVTVASLVAKINEMS